MGLGSFIKRIALPVAGIALGGPILGALGGLGGSAAGGGLGALIGGFQNSGIGQAIGPIMQGIGLFSSVTQGQSQIEQAQLANRIQSANTLEAIKFFPIKERALLAEEASLASGKVLEDAQFTEQRSRLTRALGFGTSTLNRQSASVEEQFRQLNEEQEKLIGQVASSAASRGVRVQSNQVQLQQREITKEADFARDLITLKQLEVSQKLTELNQQFQDNIFDTNIQEQINERRRGQEQERIGFEREMNIEREKTARYIADLQGIEIPGEGPEPESPEAREDRERRQREQEATLRSGIDPTISNPANMRNVPGSGNPFSIDLPFGFGNVEGRTGATEVDITTPSGQAQFAAGIENEYGIDTDFDESAY